MPASRETTLRPLGNSLGAIIPLRAAREAGIRPGERLSVRADAGTITLTRRLSDPASAEALRLLRPFLGRDIRAVAIFGSYLTRRYRAGRSDIDLFIVVKRRTIPLESRIYRALRHSGHPFGPVVLGSDELERCDIINDVRRGYTIYGTL
ncbi:MAG: nucleotidyltransferase domain-containing protein [Euryarchaeota archaeon]|nr:nucleotidyltransferase domain-containing protein [Euryarchaeota archaeon]